MKLKIYAIKDVVVGDHFNPFYLRNDEEAKRSFTNAMQEPGAKNVKDMQLFRLGEFNTETGELTASYEFLQGGAEICSTAKPIDQQ
ncbi:nonstructural protein [Dipodfec virus UOA04_Rod_907]|nr:nonstructural protein [Dipodfec virus UOA04_Rod_907]